MKRILFVSLLACLTLFSCKDKEEVDPPVIDNVDNGPKYASTEVQKRNAVLEDFTGVRCGYCPQGHAIAQGLLDDFPGKVVVVGVNAGGYAAPSAGWANFTTPYGQSLISQSGVKGYPAGTVNRQLFTGRSQNKATGLAMSRNYWKISAEDIMKEESSVNLGAKAIYNAGTKKLEIEIEAYFTSDEDAQDNYITVALLQSGMVSKQSGGGNAYKHKHVLRDFLTGQWGDLVSKDKSKKGDLFKTTITYDMPDDYNGATIPPGGGEVVLDDMELAIYIAKGHKGIITGINVPITVE